VAAGRRLAAQVVALCGTPISSGERTHPALTHAFPTPAQVTTADLSSLGMPGARRQTLKTLAQAALADPRLFLPSGRVEDAVSRLRMIKGIGEWTAQYIALRALRETDAFPASDVGLLRGAAGASGLRPTPAALLQRAEAWRPWRAYAAQHLWTAEDPATPGRAEVSQR
jgi:AraC family transcriptional regulator of adaptative response / DNA-3-methyladenine glycosylase II